MTIRWFLSGKVRQATEMHKQVRKLLNAQRDLLSPQGIEAIEQSLRDTREALDQNLPKPELEKRMAELEQTANKWLKPYPHPEWRENIEVLLVAIAVAMAIRTFFLQPFKIPTGSMQPTLYGITLEDLRGAEEAKVSSGFQRVLDPIVRGVFHHELRAKADAEFIGWESHRKLMRFINRHDFRVRYHENGRTWEEVETLWFTPDEKFEYVAASPGQTFEKGEYIIRTRETAGDHLFVDRLSYNFRRPKRGEIIVFKTQGIPRLPQNQFYIKRLVGLGGEQLRIGNDRHVYIDGEKLDASTPRFENIYTFSGPPQDSVYSGHLNGTWFQDPRIAPLFPDGNAVYPIPEDHYVALGDNTSNSLDSRAWGAFPQENVIGKSFFVYWPIANRGESRFGWAQR